MNATSDLRVVEMRGLRHRRAWLDVPGIVHADDPVWIEPLRLRESLRVSPLFNPVLKPIDAAFFVALDAGRPVGRIAAHVDARITAREGRPRGRFGFFDCIDDDAVAAALVDAAAAWLADRGATSMEGPWSYGPNEECGLLVEGFDTPPAVAMTHARPWTAALLERRGFTAVKDLLAYRADRRRPVATAARFARPLPPDAPTRVRRFSWTHYSAEFDAMAELFDDAWRDNWGFEPFGAEELHGLKLDLLPLLPALDLAFVEHDGRAVAVMLAVPDVVAASADLGGSLFPFGWMRLLGRVWSGRVRSARVALMGLRRDLHDSPLGATALLMAGREVFALMERRDLDWIELSWILEDNRTVSSLCRLVCGPPVKRYRLFTKSLHDQSTSAKTMETPVRTADTANLAK